MDKETAIIILLMACIILFGMYQRELNKQEGLERFLNFCHQHCDDVKDCSNWGDPKLKKCNDAYLDIFDTSEP